MASTAGELNRENVRPTAVLTAMLRSRLAEAKKQPAATREIAGPKVWFGHAPVHSVTMEQASSWLMRELAAGRAAPHLIMGPNAFLVTLAQKNCRFAEALRRASLCLPDGMSVVWGSRLLGKRIPERVAGGEFMERMCALAAVAGRSVYFLGGLPGAAVGAAANLVGRYPGLVIAGTDCPAKGFEQDPVAHAAVLDRIRSARPDLLCVAFGAPKQEIWMLEHCLSLPIGAAMSVGAALDTQAGLRRRAPRWTHGIGVEWLYRLAMEPHRLWRRYLIGNAEFAGVVFRQWCLQRKQQATARLLRPAPIVARTSNRHGTDQANVSVATGKQSSPAEV